MESEIEVCIFEAEVGMTVDDLNDGKSLDEYGIALEHFKAA